MVCRSVNVASRAYWLMTTDGYRKAYCKRQRKAIDPLVARCSRGIAPFRLGTCMRGPHAPASDAQAETKLSVHRSNFTRRAMPISDLSDADIDAVYATISDAHGLDILKADRRAKLLEQEKAGRISVDVVFGEIFITSRGGRLLRIKKQ